MDVIASGLRSLHRSGFEIGIGERHFTVYGDMRGIDSGDITAVAVKGQTKDVKSQS